jgi:putative tryptophan/tyrosine transport system substrate-binding protein
VEFSQSCNFGLLPADAGSRRCPGFCVEPNIELGHADDFQAAFATIAKAKADAMIVLADRFLLAHRSEIVDFAATRRLPAVYPDRAFVDVGGLLSYGANDLDQFHRTAIYVDKILKGAKPGDLPIQERSTLSS